MAQLTEAQAIEFAESEAWREWTPEQRGAFQLFQELMCLPWEVFHEGIEAALGRPVWTHEFARADDLRMEWKGLVGPQTTQDVFDALVDIAPDGAEIIVI